MKFLLKIQLAILLSAGLLLNGQAFAKATDAPIAKAEGSWLMCRVASATEYEIVTLSIQRHGKKWQGQMIISNPIRSEVPAHFTGQTIRNRIHAKVFQTMDDASQYGEKTMAGTQRYSVYLANSNRLILKAVGSATSDTYTRVKSVSEGYDLCAKRVDS